MSYPDAKLELKWVSSGGRGGGAGGADTLSQTVSMFLHRFQFSPSMFYDFKTPPGEQQSLKNASRQRDDGSTTNNCQDAR